MALDLGGQNRQDISLNEGWGYHSIFEVAKKAPFEPVTLPHTWNVRFIPGTVRYDRAMNVYNCTLTITPDMQGKRLNVGLASMGLNYAVSSLPAGSFTWKYQWKGT